MNDIDARNIRDPTTNSINLANFFQRTSSPLRVRQVTTKYKYVSESMRGMIIATTS